MEVVNNTKEQETPVTNEQKLQYENQQLKNMLNNMGKQMEQMHLANMFKRLDFLFKVVENKASFSDAFVDSCVKEIESIITISEEDNNSEEEEK